MVIEGYISQGNFPVLRFWQKGMRWSIANKKIKDEYNFNQLIVNSAEPLSGGVTEILREMILLKINIPVETNTDKDTAREIWRFLAKNGWKEIGK